MILVIKMEYFNLQHLGYHFNHIHLIFQHQLVQEHPQPIECFMKYIKTCLNFLCKWETYTMAI